MQDHPMYMHGMIATENTTSLARYSIHKIHLLS
jgi:hypothetical protein